MLNFFRKNKDKKPFAKWRLPVDPGYRMIDNEDSIQFINADESIALYYSILTVSGNGPLPGSLLGKMEPSVTRTETGWVFKAARLEENQLLVCAFSFTNESDEPMMRELYNKILYISK